MPAAETDYALDTVGKKVRSGVLTSTETRNRVLRLRRAGATFQQIAEALGRDPENPVEITSSGCSRIVRNYLDRLKREDAESVEEIRTMENERLDVMQSKLWDRVLSGDIRATRTVLTIMDRRAKLNGLDAAQRHEIVGMIAHLDAGAVADPEEVQRLEDAFKDTFQTPGLPEPSYDVEGNATEEED